MCPMTIDSKSYTDSYLSYHQYFGQFLVFFDIRKASLDWSEKEETSLKKGIGTMSKI